MKSFIKLCVLLLLISFQFQSIAQPWSTSGNSGTNSATNYIGTSDNRSLTIRSNNVSRIFVDSTGQVGIGTSTPNSQLHFSGGKFFMNATSGSNSSLISLKYKLEVQSGAVTFATFDALKLRVGIGTTTPVSALDVIGVITATGGNSDKWNLAFGWGNHALAGYLSTETDPQVGVITTGYIPRWNGTFLATSTVYDNLGGVGIGTNVVNDARLNVVQTGSILSTIKLANLTKGPNISWVHFDATGDWYIRSAADNGKVVIQDQQHPLGKVCIGTTGGYSKLNVVQASPSQPTAEFTNISSGPNISYIQYGPFGDWYIRSSSDVGKIILQNQGALASVAIGTDDPATGYKLSVNGKIICEELKVQFRSNWPDYVFSNDYELMPLETLKSFISENKHLPGVVSAKEVSFDEGIEVGKLQKQLLEKVEELTLYIIKLDEENKALSAKIEQLQKK